MEMNHILDLASALALPLITVFGVWVRNLLDEIKHLRAAIQRISDDNDREHGAVMESVRELSRELTIEVRGIVNQHSEHDKEMVRLSCKMDKLLELQK